jgi:non-ribosomal peptide synthetase component F
LNLLALPANQRAGGDRRLGGGYRVSFDAGTADRLRRVADDQNATLFSVLFAAYLLALSRFSTGHDVSCAVISSGRDLAELQNTVGFFVNAVPFVTAIHADDAFGDSVRRIHGEVVDALGHQHFPLEVLFEELKMKYPDIPVAFNMLNLSDDSRQSEMAETQAGHSPDVVYAKFDIEVYMTEYKNGIGAYWIYRQTCFSPDLFADFVAEFEKIVRFFAAAPDRTYRAYRQLGKKRSLRRGQESA